MVELVLGGAASGKSAFAEARALSLAAGGPAVYLATMQLCDGESIRRMQRHRQMRAGKGFVTVEASCRLEGIALPPGATVLLEDLPNWLANELFSPAGAGAGVLGAMQAALGHLEGEGRRLVVVSGNLFGDGAQYPPGTRQYLDLLAVLHRHLAARACRVTEVVCGLPVEHKREGVPDETVV